MEPDTKVRDRIAQPSHIATKQQHQPGSKNKQIHKKKTHSVLNLGLGFVLDGILVTT